MSVPGSVRLAGRWLAESGIQHRDRDIRLNGGVAAWYEQDKKIYPFLYSEITGYALSAWAFLGRILGGSPYLKNMERAERWLACHAQLPHGGIKTRMYLVKHYASPNYSFDNGRVYAFDTAMAGYGVMQLYRLSRRPDHLMFARDLFRFLTGKMRRKDGLFHAFYDSRTRRTGEDLEKWSDQCGSFHAKHALFFVDYHRFAGEADGARAAENLLDAACRLQKMDGRFVTSRGDGSTHLHPHAYTLEGLLYGGVFLKKPAYVKAAARGFRWMLNGVSGDGSVSSNHIEGKFSHHERSDIVAQALRIGAILYALDPSAWKPVLPTLAKIREHLMLFQFLGRGRQRGGFVYGAATDGLQRPHLNAWATMFALQAVWMHEEFVVRRKKAVLDAFV